MAPGDFTADAGLNESLPKRVAATAAPRISGLFSCLPTDILPSPPVEVRRKERCIVRLLIATGVIFAGVLLAACGDDETDSGATATPGGTTSAADGGIEIDVTLQEFSIIPEADSAEAGEITFNVENVGPDDVHEFVIMKTELDPDALPTVDDGSVDEAGEGIEVIDEIEDIPVGETQTLTVDLEAGSYVLVCNIYDETENEAHYAEGMRTAFTVE
jgi:uncharacterized cupredoxin-like copper-binding protein